MSGLLHRLAAQATGRTGPSVHSLARIPYVTPLELAEEDPTTIAPPQRMQKPEPAAMETIRTAPPIFDTQPSSRAENPGADPSQPPPLMPSLAPETPQGSAIMKDSATEQAVPAVIPESKTPGRSPNIDAQSSGHRLETVLPSVLATRHSDPELRPESAGNSPRPAEQPSAPMPTPLLGPTGPTPYQSGSASAYSPAQAFETRRQYEPENTEVHVHIGRIEVTAVHEAPREKPKRPAVRGPMTLDEYLTRRKEERK